MQTRVVLYGDSRKADSFRGVAVRKCLAEVLEMKKFQGLDIYFKRFDLGGAVIDITSLHELNNINIYAKGVEQDTSQEKDYFGGKSFLVFIGNDFVGYDYFLFDPYKKEMIGETKSANNLQALFNTYNVIRQDDYYVYKNAYGGNPVYNFSGTLGCSPPQYNPDPGTEDYNKECFDSEDNTYTHPIDGDITDTNEFHKFYKKTSLGEWWLLGEYSLQADYVSDTNYTPFPSLLIEPVLDPASYIPNGGDIEDSFCLGATHNYDHLERFVGVDSVNNLFETFAFKFSTPLGFLERRLGEVYETKENLEQNIPLESDRYIYGMLPNVGTSDFFTQTTSGSCGNLARFPHRVNYYSDGWPRFDTDTNNKRDICSRGDEELGFQIFSFSTVENFGVRDGGPCSSFWSFGQDNEDIFYICAGIKNGEELFSRDKDFEKNITNLVQHAVERQRSEGHIDHKRMFRGNLNGFIVEPLNLDSTNISFFYRQKIVLLNLINEERQKLGVAPLSYNFDLEKAADRHAVDLALNKQVNDPYGHEGSDGSTVMERIWNSGYLDGAHIDRTFHWGENIVWIPDEDGVVSDARTALDWWQTSSGHWDNIIHVDFLETGIGIRRKYSEIYKDFVTIWVQTFGYNSFNTG